MAIVTGEDADGSDREGAFPPLFIYFSAMPSRIWDTKEIRRKDVSVGELYKTMHEKAKLKQINGDIGRLKLITDKNVHRPGLALAGYVDLFTYNRVQIFGNTEVRYLSSLKFDDRRRALETILQFDIPCVIIANSNEIEQELIDTITAHGVSVSGARWRRRGSFTSSVNSSIRYSRRAQ